MHTLTDDQRGLIIMALGDKATHDSQLAEDSKALHLPSLADAFRRQAELAALLAKLIEGTVTLQLVAE